MLTSFIDIDQIESRRPKNPDTDAIYLLSPESHIVDCLVADLEKRCYRRAFLIWTSRMSTVLNHREADSILVQFWTQSYEVG